MKILERGSVILSVIGLVMKIFRLNGGNELLEIGLTLLAMVYFYLGFAVFNNIRLKDIFKKSSYSNISSGRIVGAIGVGMNLSIIVIGLLFKLLIFAGAFEMLTIGVTSLTITLFAALIVFILKKKNLDFFYKDIFVKGAIAVIIGIALCLTPGSSLIRLYHRDDPAYAELFIRAMQNPRDEKIQKAFDEATDKKYNYQKK
jgi:hypothetical protein